MSLKKRSFVCTRVPIRMCSMIMWQKYSNTMSNSMQEYSSAYTRHHQDDADFDDRIPITGKYEYEAG